MKAYRIRIIVEELETDDFERKQISASILDTFDDIHEAVGTAVLMIYDYNKDD